MQLDLQKDQKNIELTFMMPHIIFIIIRPKR